MDTRDTPEQAELRRSARQLTRELSARTVADLDDETRAQRLATAVRDAGWLELRDDVGDGTPVASGVEAAIVADALGAAAADVAFTGQLLARDLARRGGVAPIDGAAVAMTPNLFSAAVFSGSTTIALPVPDAAAAEAYLLVPDDSIPDEDGDFGSRLGRVPVEQPGRGADLTRRMGTVPAGATVTPVEGSRALTLGDIVSWGALGMALTCADLVGVMRGVLDVTVEYAKERQQYGVPVGSFQAVQHLLAEAHCLMEGSTSVALHAAWAADALAPGAAHEAAQIAKVYCARAARTVCETAVQVHGGIGNTWDCIAHVYLRRALLSTQWCGDDAFHLRDLARERIGIG